MVDTDQTADDPMQRLLEKKKFRTDVVIIEDNETDREQIGALIEQCGYKALKIKDSRKTTNILDSQKVSWIPEAIILNLVLSGSSGYELLRSLKGRFELKKVPVVVVSSMSAEEDIFEAQTAGATAYVVKPYEEEKLLEALAFSLENLKKALSEQKLGIYVAR